MDGGDPGIHTLAQPPWGEAVDGPVRRFGYRSLSRMDHHQKSYESWESASAGWARRGDFIFQSTRPVSAWMVNKLGGRPGETILELAAGPGDTGFMAAEALGPGGRLIASDFSPGMLSIARDRAAKAGLNNVEFRVLDAQEMDLPDGSVDGVLCRFGYMLMIDQAAAFSETRRVLKNGGRVVFGVWGQAERNPWLSLPGMIAVMKGLIEMPDPDAPGGVFSLSQPEVIETTLKAAGFEAVQVEEVPVAFRYGSEEEQFSFLVEASGFLGQALRAAEPGPLEEFRTELAAQFEAFKVGEAYEVPGIALGTRAAAP